MEMAPAEVLLAPLVGVSCTRALSLGKKLRDKEECWTLMWLATAVADGKVMGEQISGQRSK